MPMLCKHCGEVEAAIRQNSIHHSAYCTVCGAFIKHVPQSETDFKMPFGKYKGVRASDLVQTDLNYARWAHQNMDKLSVKYLAILGNLLP